jgi:hypothetical protein
VDGKIDKAIVAELANSSFAHEGMLPLMVLANLGLGNNHDGNGYR